MRRFEFLNDPYSNAVGSVLTDKLLKELEVKITKKIIGNIDNMLAEKCKKIFQNQGRDHSVFFLLLPQN